jgi:protein-S-isoprenylcysteine O-methyltransferase Ste14
MRLWVGARVPFATARGRHRSSGSADLDFLVAVFIALGVVALSVFVSLIHAYPVVMSLITVGLAAIGVIIWCLRTETPSTPRHLENPAKHSNGRWPLSGPGRVDRPNSPPRQDTHSADATWS